LSRALRPARLAELGGVALAGSPVDSGKFIGDETEKWAKVIKFAGVKVRPKRGHPAYGERP
jgi:hypothetical protein